MLAFSWGCGFQVKDTSGIMSCLTKVNLAEQAAYDLKKLYQGDEEAIAGAAQDYDLAVATVKAYVQTIDMEVAGTYTADVSSDDFGQSEAKTLLDAFLDKSRELEQRKRPPDTVKDGTAIAVALIVAGFVIDKIVEIDGKAKEAGYKRFRKLLFGAVPVQFSLITEEYMLNKYSGEVKRRMGPAAE